MFAKKREHVGRELPDEQKQKLYFWASRDQCHGITKGTQWCFLLVFLAAPTEDKQMPQQEHFVLLLNNAKEKQESDFQIFWKIF